MPGYLDGRPSTLNRRPRPVHPGVAKNKRRGIELFSTARQHEVVARSPRRRLAFVTDLTEEHAENPRTCASCSQPLRDGGEASLFFLACRCVRLLPRMRGRQAECEQVICAACATTAAAGMGGTTCPKRAHSDYGRQRTTPVYNLECPICQESEIHGVTDCGTQEPKSARRDKSLTVQDTDSAAPA
jgi:hypothetical protein